MTHRTDVDLFSTKTYTHSVGLSCVFRQWRAKSHCRFLHGYALEVKVVFGCTETDDNGWVQDFGGLKSLKKWLEETFDHKTLIARDDPALHLFRDMSMDFKSGPLIQLVEVDRVGCESFARMIFDYVDNMMEAEDNLISGGTVKRVFVQSVEVREHAGNSAIAKRR
jgi:6-pyruvoyltetrahydropterin/6-carboxytetrahydropterin synthase